MKFAFNTFPYSSFPTFLPTYTLDETIREETPEQRDHQHEHGEDDEARRPEHVRGLHQTLGRNIR